MLWSLTNTMRIECMVLDALALHVCVLDCHCAKQGMPPRA